MKIIKTSLTLLLFFSSYCGFAQSQDSLEYNDRISDFRDNMIDWTGQDLIHAYEEWQRSLIREKDNTDDPLNATEASATTQFDISNIQLTGNACCFSYGIGSK